LQWNKRPGAVLDASCVLARIILDDSQQVQQSQLYDGKFTFQLFDQSK
ncbi:unnamed protein product, partial [Rotaria socialis]